MNAEDRRNLEVEAVLDPDQAEALTAALKQNLTIIQGPPGTGKPWIHTSRPLCYLSKRHLSIPHASLTLFRLGTSLVSRHRDSRRNRRTRKECQLDQITLCHKR
jgi:hypothetical protein